jgi:putative Mg2+ transporter-C (MgtC) family protein
MEYNAEILLRFLLAGLWGGLVGAEREYRGKAAGFRTTIMISIGACFFTMMSIIIGGHANADRIASNIVTGIGFLGAGVIFHGDNRVNGITTAATIWAVAAVGMGIGAGYYFASACACVLILFVLAVLPYVETYIDILHQTKTYTIRCDFSEGSLDHYEQLMAGYKLKYRLIRQMKHDAEWILTWEVRGHSRKHKELVQAIAADDSVKRFEV